YFAEVPPRAGKRIGIFGFHGTLPDGMRLRISCASGLIPSFTEVRSFRPLVRTINIEEKTFYRLPDACLTSRYVWLSVRVEGSAILSRLKPFLRTLDWDESKTEPSEAPLEGYLAEESLGPGQKIELKAQSQLGKFRVRIRRFGDGETVPLFESPEISAGPQ